MFAKNRKRGSTTPCLWVFQKRVYKKSKMTAKITKNRNFSTMNELGYCNIREVEI